MRSPYGFPPRVGYGGCGLPMAPLGLGFGAMAGGFGYGAGAMPGSMAMAGYPSMMMDAYEEPRRRVIEEVRDYRDDYYDRPMRTEYLDDGYGERERVVERVIERERDPRDDYLDQPRRERVVEERVIERERDPRDDYLDQPRRERVVEYDSPRYDSRRERVIERERESPRYEVIERVRRSPRSNARSRSPSVGRRVIEEIDSPWGYEGGRRMRCVSPYGGSLMAPAAMLPGCYGGFATPPMCATPMGSFVPPVLPMRGMPMMGSALYSF